MPTLQVAIDARGATKGAAEYAAATDKVKASSAGAAVAGDKVGTAVETAGKKAGRSSIGFLKAQAAIAAFTNATRFIRDAVGIIATFEETLATVGVVSGATAGQLIDLRDAARQMGATTRFSATEAGEGLLFLSRAGFEANQAIQALAPTLALAQAGAIGVGSAADIASNTLSQFRLETSEMTRVADGFIAVTNRTNTDVKQLAEALKFAGPVAGALGKTFEETASALGVLGDAGIQASLAGTALRGIFSQLLGPTDKAKNALAQMNLTLADINPQTNSLIDIFDRFRKANITAGQAVDIFGRRNAAAAVTIAASAEKLRELNEQTIAAGGESSKVAKVIDDTLSGSLKQLKSSIEEAVLAFGDSGFAAALRDVVDVATATVRILSGMSDAVDENRRLAEFFVSVIKGLAAALATLIFLKVAAFFFGVASAVIAATSSFTALSVAVAANPFGFAVAAVGLLTIALLELKNTFGGVTEAARQNETALTKAERAADRLADAAGREARAILESKRREQIREINDQVGAVKKLIEINDKLKAQGATEVRAVATATVGNERETAVQRTQREAAGQLSSAELAARKLVETQIRAKSSTDELGKVIRNANLEAVALGGAFIQLRKETGVFSDEIVAFVEIDELIKRLTLRRDQLIASSKELTAAEKASTDETRAAAKAVKDRTQLVVTLIALRQKLTGELNAASAEEASRAERQRTFIEQAIKIAKTTKATTEETAKFVAEVKKELAAVEAVEDALKRKRAETAAAAASEKLHSQQIRAATKALNDLKTSLLGESEILKVQAEDTSLLARQLEIRRFGTIALKAATEGEKVAVQALVQQLLALAAANDAATKAEQARQQLAQAQAGALQAIQATIGGLEDEIKALEAVTEGRIASIEAIRLERLAKESGLKGQEEEIKLVEKLIQRRAELRNQVKVQGQADTQAVRVSQPQSSPGGGVEVSNRNNAFAGTPDQQGVVGPQTTEQLQGLIQGIRLLGDESGLTSQRLSENFGRAFNSIEDGSDNLARTVANIFNDIFDSVGRLISKNSALGNVFEGGRSKFFASGGVIGSEFSFPLADGRVGVGGESGPEGILPLSRDRFGRLGVTFVPDQNNAPAAQTGGSVVVHMTVNTPNADSFRRSRRQIVSEFQRQNPRRGG